MPGVARRWQAGGMYGPALELLQRLPHDAWRLRAAAFAALLAGRTPVLDDLAVTCGLDAAETARLCHLMIDAGALGLEAGAVVASAGLTARATDQSITLAGRTVHTVCAIDAFGIAA